MPYEIKAECPCCKVMANGLNEVERVFGFRTMNGDKRIPQSYCNACRSAGCKAGEPCKVKH